MPTYLLVQNTTLEIWNKFRPILHLFHVPGVSHAYGFPHWSILIRIRVESKLTTLTLYLHFTFLPLLFIVSGPMRAARVFQ
jgi:hypothetical protein